MSLTPTFQGEVQMRRWSDSSTQGVQVTFALPDASDLEPLKTKAGKRFMAVLVEIGDDEQPIQAPRKDTRGPLCREACDLCANPEFQQWVSPYGYTADEGGARRFIYENCEIRSRKQLDTESLAAQKFVSGVRIPFMKRRKR